MRYQNDGITLWYGTPDTPAPENTIPLTPETRITIGIQPPAPNNRVEIRYRVNSGNPIILPAVTLRTIPSTNTQYFRAIFPIFQVGDRIDYTVICRSAGRQVPSSTEAQQWLTTFTLEENSDAPSTETPHEVIGQLRHESTNSPLTGFIVRATLQRNQEATELGDTITNSRGYFSFTYSTPADEANRPPVSYSLSLEILTAENVHLHQTTVSLPEDPEQILDVRIPTAEPPEPPSPALAQIASFSGSQLSAQLLSSLSDRGIKTIADLKHLDRDRNIPELSPNTPALKHLQAHANLSLLSNDIQLNSTLIERGFSSIDQIASETRADFVIALSDQQGDFKAAQLQVKARAQKAFLNNVATGISADLANGFPNPLLDSTNPDNNPEAASRLNETFNPTCSCQSCEAATSPIAYLADLLDYATTNVKNNGAALSLDNLAEIFHQPFGDLPTSCDIQEKKERQIRLCIETLRSYLKVHPATDIAETALTQAEKQYRLNAYQTLLNQLGTSYDELRQTRGNESQSQALAERLGIAPDKLDLLFLDPDAAAPAPKALTEKTLEQLFGLQATDRYPLTPPKKRGDPLNQVVEWEFQGVDVRQNTDPDGYVYLILGLIRGISEYVWTVGVFSDHDRTQLVASGSSAATPESSVLPGNPADRFQGTIALAAVRNSGLTGSITLNYQADSAEIAVNIAAEAETVPVEGLLEWRLQYLRSLWQTEDGLVELPSQTPPIIDPDLIGLAYITHWSDPNDPAYQLWQARTEWIALQLNAFSTYSQDLAGFNQAIASLPGAPDLAKLSESQAAGIDIAPRLKEINLSRGAFAYLVRIQNLLAQSSTVLRSEWEEVYNILVQVQKIGQFSDWRSQERNNNVVLTPSSFKVPQPPPLEFPPVEPQPLPTWRATQQALRQWEEKLKSRIEQELTIKVALQSAISATEEATLVTLRDALILASGVEGESLPDKADGITKSLLIDAQMGSCQATTRIAQAIETIQSLLWGLKVNQFREIYPDLDLGDKESFDEKWKWLGSYATWRSAMFVFLYPENILRPELRKWQTPAFQQLVKNVRNNRRLTPESACKEAQAYADYFTDIASLDIEATCQTNTRIHSGNCRNRVAKDLRSLFYLFARGKHTNAVYWSAYDPQDVSGYAQTLWEKVPGLEAEEVRSIVGAVPYQISEEERSVYLFFEVQGDPGSKLVLTTYNLQTQQWSGQLTELEVPEDATSFSAVVEQRDKETQTPHLAVCTSSQKAYSLKLNLDGTDWQNPDNPHVLTSDGVRIKSVLSLVFLDIPVLGAFNFIFVESGRNEIQVGIFSQVRTDQPVALWGSLGRGSWIGAFLYPGTAEKVYFYLRDSSGIRYGIVASSNFNNNRFANPSTFLGSIELDRIAIHSGQESGISGRRLAYRSTSGQAGTYQAVFVRTIDDRIKILSSLRLTPKVGRLLSILEQLSEEKLHFRRCLMETTFKENAASQSNLTYIQEAYYFVPIYLALQLQQQRYFPAALNWYRTVYAYNLTIIAPNQSTDPNSPNLCETPPEDQPKIYYGLKLEESLSEVYKRAEDWLLDPLNPHLIASSRRNTYTRYTLLSIVRCFLEYADDEFTRDTAESIARARTLYLDALALLDRLEQQANICLQVTDALDSKIHNQLSAQFPALIPVWNQIKQSLLTIKDKETLSNIVQEIDVVMMNEETWIAKLRAAEAIITQALLSLPKPPSLTELLQQKAQKYAKVYATLLAQPKISKASAQVANLASKDYTNAVSVVSGITPQALQTENISFAWLRQKVVSTIPEPVGFASSAALPLTAIREDYQRLARYNPVAPTHLATLAQIAKSYPLQAVQIAQQQPNTFTPSPIYGFCLPLNPILDALRLWGELNLYKLRTCRNIAGIEREISPYAAPTDTFSGLPQIGTRGQLVLPGSISFPATPYRYIVLIDRAKQLVSIAQQVEASFLSALEKLDAELYNLLKARQDMQLSQAGVRLQDLRIREAESGVDLAELQKDRSQIQADYYQDLLDEGLIEREQESLSLLGIAALFYGATGFFGFSGPEGVAQAASTTASLLGQWASYERREQEWKFQETLAQQDVRISVEQIRVAQDRVRIVGQERAISQMQADFAKEILDFLTTKFTNAELYDWMVGILEQVYSFFLQQATATAKLAENQLAFERQQIPPAYIQSDYWEIPNDNLAGGTQNSSTPDRRGLTGSARLLQDIYQLDQYAFETDQRKLQLTKTLSLARLAPAEFQRFRETGILLFSTPMELFDRDFPGHYLRLIKRVRTSIIALIPPIEGIKATLSSTGLSRVVINQNNIFQTQEIPRPPESVALTSPRDATGLFELTPQSQELLLPFESMGVEASWELRLPKAANLFDYSTIADVLITIEYTALDSFTYRQQVIQTLGSTISGDRPFSFRNEFADQWFDLNNPDQTATPMTVRFETRRTDFPPNLEDLSIQQVVLYIARKDGDLFEVPLTLNYSEQNGTEVGGEATTVDGTVSTRRGNAISWISMIGRSPFGEWALIFPDEPNNVIPDGRRIRELFDTEQIEDILFVITYQGHTAKWPT